MTREPDPLLLALGERVRAHRRRARLTQRQLADLAVMDQPYLAQIETGRRNPSYLVLCRLARVLGLHPGVLFPEDLSDPALMAPERDPSGHRCNEGAAC